MALMRRTGHAAAALALVLLLNGVAAHGAGWLENYEDALAQAKKKGKPILADFTGSDWCGWCIKLKSEVFDTEAFKTWAKKNVILLELDYPRRTQQPADIKKQNKELAQKYGIRGFPTILFLDAQGTVIGRSGYMKGGPETWTAKADEILANAPKPKVVEPHATFTAAMEAAKKNEKLLLALFVSKVSKTYAKKAQEMLKDPAWTDFATGWTEAVIVPASSRKPKTDAEKAVSDFMDKHEIKRPTFGVALYDPKDEKLLHYEKQVKDEAALLKTLQGSLPTVAYDGGWVTDFEKAQRIAQTNDRSLFLFFTGSDWCPYCKKLDQEFLQSDAFKTYAKDHLVLVLLDFPKKTQLPPKQMEHNKRLAQKYGVRGFPTVFVTDANGQVLTRLGYKKDALDMFMKMLKDGVAKAK